MLLLQGGGGRTRTGARTRVRTVDSRRELMTWPRITSITAIRNMLKPITLAWAGIPRR